MSIGGKSIPRMQSSPGRGKGLRDKKCVLDNLFLQTEGHKEV